MRWDNLVNISTTSSYGLTSPKTERINTVATEAKSSPKLSWPTVVLAKQAEDALITGRTAWTIQGHVDMDKSQKTGQSFKASFLQVVALHDGVVTKYGNNQSKLARPPGPEQIASYG